ILGDLQEIFPQIQFIVTTHAPAVINSVRSENVVILDGEAREPRGEVFGKDVNSIIRSVMGASERPVAIKELFNEFYAALDAGNLAGAEAALARVEEEIGTDDADLVACRTRLRIRKIRGTRP
ncbi:MAG: ATP-binding protein, partial [Thermoguttaceae bacterium]|nr:ATP-binding protein [Thermoguttaceae bacterium]